MMYPMRILTAAAAALVVLTAMAGTALGGNRPPPVPGVAHQHAGTQPKSCPVTGAGPYVTCVRAPDSSGPDVGQEITDGAGADPGTPWMVTDHDGAPMAWVNLYGLYSGGDGGRMAGGLMCVTYGVASYSACLTPTGTLQLTPTGPDGATGPTETLTPAGISELRALEAAHITIADLRWLARKGR